MFKFLGFSALAIVSAVLFLNPYPTEPVASVNTDAARETRTIKTEFRNESIGWTYTTYTDGTACQHYDGQPLECFTDNGQE